MGTYASYASLAREMNALFYSTAAPTRTASESEIARKYFRVTFSYRLRTAQRMARKKGNAKEVQLWRSVPQLRSARWKQALLALSRAARPGGGAALAQRHAPVQPSPATHAILTVRKAGESVFQPFLWTKTVFRALREAQPLLHALFGVKTLSGTLFAPPFA